MDMIKKIAKSMLISLVILVLVCFTILPISMSLLGEKLGSILTFAFVETTLLVYLIIK